VDAFRDRVTTLDVSSSGDELTPSGTRNVQGGFIQSQLTFFDRLDLITALRYDTYELSGGNTELDGSRASPKATIGYKFVKGITPYVTYAEGYRAPALTETVIQGFHPVPPFFTLLPNPNLRPEVAHNWEAGVNFKFDGIVSPKDVLRARLSAFRNKIDDYIDPEDKSVFDPTFPPPGDPAWGTFQYINRPHVTIEGIEFEGMYDARSWFFGVAASHLRGTDDTTGLPLLSIPAHKLVLTTGFRAFDQKLTAGTRVRFVAAQDRVPPTLTTLVTDSYTVVDLFAQYAFDESMILSFAVDNVFDEHYRQYLDQSNSPGLNARVGFTMRFGATAGTAP
jgi:hemoglobin/transferrin/lactoferrin receptor protein